MITNTTISTARRVSGTGLFDATEILSDVPALIEPVSDTKQAMYESEMGVNLHEMFLFGEYDIEKGDKVTDASANTFVVKNIKHFRGNPFIPSTVEIILATSS